MNNIKDHIEACNRPRGRLISIVLPVFNEQESLPHVLDELFGFLGETLKEYLFEVTFIDDASTDDSVSIILAKAEAAPQNVRVSVCCLAKNSGGHVAITAGLNMARGDFTVVMASDGQDPASLVGDLLSCWVEEHDIVLAAREVNMGQGKGGRILSGLAWRVMSWSTQIEAPKRGCDVLGLDRKALDAFNRMDERNTTFIFRILSLGFRRKEVVYVKREREKGRSNWNVWSKMYIFLDAITGYSSRPLRLITGLGMLTFVLIGLRWISVMYKVYFLGQPSTDLEIILNSMFTSLSVVIILLGAMGDYIWRILEETRKRPLYDICDVKGQIFDSLEGDH